MAVYLYMCLIVTLCLTLTVTGGGMLVGGYVPIDPNRDDVQKAANFAVTKYNEITNDANIYKLNQVESAESQVVAGTNYKIVSKIGRTSCRKNHAAECDLANSEVTEVKQCSFTVFRSLPPETFSLTNFSCNP
ncbi:cystatin-like isoform X2 [Phyllobates terribilis]|uniref:cystatin-like isoform X2 n=1 Tax=Phyllobates terribilis TaxID=111132 RepID=UPI003CCAEB01